MSLVMKLGNRRILLFTLILVLKGALAWFVVFEDGPSWLTLWTEIPFFWVVFCLIEWFAKKRKMLYYTLVNLLFTLLYFTVLMYYKYYGIIVTYHAITQAGKVTQVGDSTYSLMDPYYLLIFVDIIVIAAVLIWVRRKSTKLNRPLQVAPIAKPVIGVMFVLSIALCIFNIWPNRASMNEKKQAEEMGILNYEVFTIFADTTDDEDPAPAGEITQANIDQLKGLSATQTPANFGAAKGKNVIIIQMESFQNFLIDLKIDGKEITPNINKLAKEEFHYNNFYTMVGQGTTSDAEYVVNTSLYIPKHGAATEKYVEKALPSLPKMMKANGYDTATFHTNDVSFWNRTELYDALGWDRYYDKSFYGDEDHIAFGASDEVLFPKTIEKLTEMDQADKPFYSMVISMSAHHPFHLPEAKYKMELPERFEDTLVGNYIRAQNYADWAIGQFIEDLKTSGLWEDSIVLFYGDHQGVSLYALDDHEKELMNEVMDREYGYTDMFNIPLIMHAPGVTYPAKLEQAGGQIDILPTVANLVGISLDNQIHFGQDLLNATSNILPMRHFLPTGSFVNDSVMFLPGISFEDGTNYSVEDNAVEADGATEDESERALELLHLSDSYVEHLPYK
ncbi:phosphoglycerol transferase MdoB-like AlkP superfamily enzyme [Paenibacillus phyllosphaerae]|uniref:Phosphoglycerol transferase MdoB-like AlkP superfamily enzyme n=1 Tax=Paenibacillus phyllosphaerae TaxID=274593 RepID=A0A7W5AU04_9BACL|nr:LTA synthase family protein [Paenibacillus phyllosphaerae]MBB3108770.1 phosphoglycerol transferase MdoB-like AlkP superfamily enzyme [Paenibacillus phyllosphaerae]